MVISIKGPVKLIKRVKIAHSFLLRWDQSRRNEGILFKLWRKEIPKNPNIFILFHWPQATYHNRSGIFIALLNHFSFINRIVAGTMTTCFDQLSYEASN